MFETLPLGEAISTKYCCVLSCLCYFYSRRDWVVPVGRREVSGLAGQWEEGGNVVSLQAVYPEGTQHPGSFSPPAVPLPHQG